MSEKINQTNSTNWIYILLAIFVLVILGTLGTYYILLISGYFTTPTSLQIKTDVESINCIGNVDIFIELADQKSSGITAAPIEVYINGRKDQALKTDINGRIWLREEILQGWCGEKVEFLAKYEGNNNYKPTFTKTTIVIKAPTQLQIEMPNEAIENESIQIYTTLRSGIDDRALPNRKINIETVSSETNSQGIASFTFRTNRTGIFDFIATYNGEDSLEPARSNTGRIVVSKATCPDGTIVGRCSGTYMCTEYRELAFNCGKCGCPGALICFDNQCINEEERVGRIVESLQKIVVLIKTENSQGSGVIIRKQDNDSETWILTNRHVIDKNFDFAISRNIIIETNKNETARPKRIHLAPEKLDLAVLVIDKHLGEVAVLEHENSTRRGSTIFALGAPLGIQNSVSKGIVSNFIKTKTITNFEYEAIQTDVALNPGNSGGGIFLSSNGKLIGITTFKSITSSGQLAEGLGFAIPADLLERYPVESWMQLTRSG